MSPTWKVPFADYESLAWQRFEFCRTGRQAGVSGLSLYLVLLGLLCWAYLLMVMSENGHQESGCHSPVVTKGGSVRPGVCTG